MMNDFHLALRSLARSRSFSLVALATIAISIGATVSIFSVVHGVLLEPLPFRDPSRLVTIWETDAHNASFEELASAPDYADWKREARSFSGMAGTTQRQVNVRSDGGTERLTALGVTRDFFDVVGLPLHVGRTFLATEDAPGGAPAVILPWAMWQERFGGDPAVVGRSLVVDGTPHAIVGVAARAMRLGDPTPLFVPFAQIAGPFLDARGVHDVFVWARLAPGATLEGARHEMVGIMRELERLYPNENRGRGAAVEPMHEVLVGDVREPVLVLFGAAGLVLLIGCANVAGLMLARGIGRARELEVRAALGASRWHVVRQVLTESLVLALAGAAAGTLLALWGVRLLTSFAPNRLPRIENIDVDPAVLGFSLLSAVLSGLLFGILPAVRASGSVSRFAASGRGITGRRARARTLLVAGEIAFAVVLTIASGLLLRSFWNLVRVDPGFEPRGLVTFNIALPSSSYPEPSGDEYPGWPEVTEFYERLLHELRTTPGLESAALAIHHPLNRGWRSPIRVDGRPVPEGPVDKERMRGVSPGYFATIGTPILRGRDLDAGDTAEAPKVVLINEAFAQRHFPGENPVGRRIWFWGQSREIVGLVANVRFMGPRRPAEPAFYPPLAQVPTSDVAVVVRAGANPLAHLGAIREALERADPALAPSDIRTLDRILLDSIGTERFQMLLISLFGATALLLAAVGIFGLVAHQVEQRRAEIGIRMALGATRRDVTGMVVGEGGRLAAAGAGMGVAAALALTRVLESTLFEVDTRDAAVYAAAIASFAVVALIASWLPARRAAAVDPNIVLRYE
ncbi:MAG: ABC transporter permease [Thermoanaerobaculia bacterium]